MLTSLTYVLSVLDAVSARRGASFFVPNLCAISLTLLPTFAAVLLADKPAALPDPKDALTDGFADCDAPEVLPVAPAALLVVADVLGTTLDLRSLVTPPLVVPDPDADDVVAVVVVEGRSKEALLFAAEAVLVVEGAFDTDDLSAVLLLSSPAAVFDAASRSCPGATLVALRLVLAVTGGLVGGLLRLLPCV